MLLLLLSLSSSSSSAAAAAAAVSPTYILLIYSIAACRMRSKSTRKPRPDAVNASPSAVCYTYRPFGHQRHYTYRPPIRSDVNKDLTFKAKDKDKDQTLKVKDQDKD